MTLTTNNFYLSADWPSPPNVQAVTFLRDSQVCPQGRAYNPQRIAHFFAQPTFFSLQQIHSPIVKEAIDKNFQTEGDALFTREKNLACIMLTADCLPIFITNRQGTVVALVHAGWRGLAADILHQTLKALNLPPEEVLVWIGPAIGADKFIVKSDVYQAFMKLNLDLAAAFRQVNATQWACDLVLIAKLQLSALKILQIFGGTDCTASATDKFYSYRSEGEATGRLVNMIWMQG